ncbi:DUF4383 domain-containing protein [Prauserella sp. PE36]|uniref:DUF4383 domain-containing protein n=1 Tax=Prauserella endophytica TaxID=1592324 RepID=A0ABY2S6A5_9PSEU|nr:MULTISPECIES: DUF4383 domain-containing protein [Prauserella]PXY21661.1 hypothetical protein BAY59_29865 [Prauserella coralliicola]RBM20034.1 DUF4383 domain-containing protein [Prauserella sp. PE36]TKG71440.1 DUF4383 domain-containing protein [Prauserella endophytica]
MDPRADARVGVAGVQPAQVLAAIVGLVYLAIGIIGFVLTGFGGFTHAEHSTLWLFSINPLHNVVHVVIGVLGLLMALNAGLARTFGWLLFIGYGVVFVWGLAITGVFSSNPVSGLGNPLALNTADNWLHLGSALVGLLIAIMPARKKVVTSAEPVGSPAGGPAEGGSTAMGENPAATTQPRHRPRRRPWRRGAHT